MSKKEFKPISFEDAFQYTLRNSDCSDNFMRGMAVNKLGSLSHQFALENNLEHEAVSHILTDNLEEYRQFNIVDDTSGDYYKLIASAKIDNLSVKSSLGDPEKYVQEFLKEYPVVQTSPPKFPDEPVEKEELKSYLSTSYREQQTSPPKFPEPVKKEEVRSFLPSNYQEQQKLISPPYLPTNYREQQTSPPNLPEPVNREEVRSFLPHYQDQKKLVLPPATVHVQPPADPPSKNKFVYKTPESKNLNYINYGASKNVEPETCQELVERKSDFVTASTELANQNLKKYGSVYAPTGPPLFSYANIKKRLGGKPPIQSQPRYGGQAKKPIDEKIAVAETATPDDERLQNIDPVLVQRIRDEIMSIDSDVNWNEIAGLEYAKTVIREAVVLPLLRPEIFTGLRRPPKGILLFGPPGTGKTLIGKCIASQVKATFFSISASALTSKWIGEGEKMVKALFAVASVHQPSVVFIDEIDSLLCQRSETEHESSRRMKTEFLVQLDGTNTREEDRVLIVGATNRPQELDEAARRRLVKRLYIPLPEHKARVQLLSRLITKNANCLTAENVEEVGRLTDGYSGADIKTLCQEAAMGPVRMVDFENITEIDLRPINFEDFRNALKCSRPSVSQNDLQQYVVWNNTYGCGTSG